MPSASAFRLLNISTLLNHGGQQVEGYLLVPRCPLFDANYTGLATDRTRQSPANGASNQMCALVGPPYPIQFQRLRSATHRDQAKRLKVPHFPK